MESKKKKNRRSWLKPEDRPETPVGRPAECRNMSAVEEWMRANEEMDKERLAKAAGEWFSFLDVEGEAPTSFHNLAESVIILKKIEDEKNK